MSDDDVVRAVRTLQRHGMPVPMSDEAALTFIAGFLSMHGHWQRTESGDNAIERYELGDERTPTVEEATTQVLAIYERVTAALNGHA